MYLYNWDTFIWDWNGCTDLNYCYDKYIEGQQKDSGNHLNVPGLQALLRVPMKRLVNGTNARKKSHRCRRCQRRRRRRRKLKRKKTGKKI